MNNKRRINSISLMRELQPFVQGGLLSAASAKKIVTGYVKGDDEMLLNFIQNPEMPMMYEGCVTRITKVIGN